MFKWLFRGGGKAGRASGKGGKNRPRTPENMRVYAVGDIHGRRDLLEDLISVIKEDASHRDPSTKVKVIFLGDYVDRGMDSRGVIDLLLSRPFPDFETVFLKGNHEQAVIDFLREPKFGGTWKYYGGLETLHSYGVTGPTVSDEPDVFEAAAVEFAHALPNAHLDFLSNLPVSAVVGDYFLVHAGVRPGISIERQSAEDMLWIRDSFLNSREDFGKVIVHGHTPTEEPVIAPNRIGIDTGAYMTGVLTALVLEGEEQRFLQTGAGAGRAGSKFQAIGA